MVRRMLTLEEAVAKMRKRHGDRYEYPMSQIYGGATSNVRIVCRIHGEFLQRASNHMHGQNCPRCGAEHRRSRAQEQKRFKSMLEARTTEAKASEPSKPFGGLQRLPFWS